MRSKLLSLSAAALMLAPALAMAQTPPPSPPAAPAERMTPPIDRPAPIEKMPSTEAPSGNVVTHNASDEWRASNLVGLAVYNAAGDRIGDINELIVDGQGKISTVVLGVGGFLGLGEKLVGLPFGDLTFSRDNNGRLHAMSNSSKESLQTAPDYKYRATAETKN